MSENKNVLSAILSFLLALVLHLQVQAQYPAGSPVAVNGKLKVIGPYLRNECGNPVQLRGMSTHGVQWFQQCINASSIEALANDWEADVFRLAMYIKDDGYNSNPNYWKGRLDFFVDECGKRGIYAIIDFHVLRPGDPNAYLPEAREFWTYMATKHKGKKHVLYEICNEPNNVSWAKIKQYAHEIIPLIRNIDPETMIIVGNPTWSQDVNVVAEDPLPYPNLTYALHFYNHGEYLRIKANRALAKGLPLFVSEFGTTDPHHTMGPLYDQMEVWNQWMYDNKISWANWSFCDKDELSAALTPGACSGNWNSTSPSGTWVKNKIKTPDNFTCNGDTFYVKAASAPYSGNPFTVPGKLQAENYDLGSNGVAFRNYELKQSVYRQDGPEIILTRDSADILAVGDFIPGEWLNYSINVPAAGKYDFQLRLSSPADNQLILLTINGKRIATLTLPNTGLLFQTITVPNVSLEAGLQDLRIQTVTKGPVIDFIHIVPSLIKGNRIPQVAVTSPSPGALFTGPATINLKAFAADQDGNIAKVQFYNGDKLIGEDKFPPYTFVWNNVPAATYTVRAVAIDYGNGFSYSEPVKVTVLSAGSIPANGSGLNGEYFNNSTLSGSPALTRLDENISFSWNSTTPAPEIGGRTFSVKWTGRIKPTLSGKYTFYVKSDEGVRLYIDNMPVIYNWNSHSSATDSVILDLTAGAFYDLKLEYYNQSNAAEAVLEWKTAGLPRQVVPKENLYPAVPYNIFPYVEITIPSAVSSYTAPATVYLHAKAYDPEGSVTKVEFYSGSTLLSTDFTAPYTFVWNDVPGGVYSITAFATDNLGRRVASKMNKVAVGVPGGLSGNGLKGEYFNNINLSGNPAWTRTDAEIDFTWLASSPAPVVRTDSFSVRWTGKIEPLFSEEYTFYTTANDGVRLYVNNNLLIDNWAVQNTTSNSAKVTLEAGKKYDIRYEYFDNVNHALVKLEWSSPSQPRQIVPVLNLYSPRLTRSFPTVYISSPLNNTAYLSPGQISIIAETADQDGMVTKVEFFDAGTKIGEDVSAPFIFDWANVPAGVHTITAKATDNNGNTTSSSVVSVSVSGSNTAPSVTLTSPSEGAGYTSPASIVLSANATDADGNILRVEFYNQTEKIGEDLTSPYSMSWTGVGPGNYSISAKAIDNFGGNTTTPPVLVTVTPPVNNPPSVSISSPVTNTTYAAPATIALHAAASDADGTVTLVEFFDGTEKIGEDLTSPYSLTLSNQPAGTFSFTAKATDNSGNSASSETVTVNVTNSTTECVADAIPAAAEWVLRNDWSDQSNNSTVTNSPDGLRITHRQWGQDRIFAIQTGRSRSVTSGVTYRVSFEFKNDPAIPVENLEIGLARSAGNGGPVLAQPAVTVAAGAATGSFTGKTVNITSAESGNAYLSIGLRWPAQVSAQSNTFIRNIAVCPVSSTSRMDISGYSDIKPGIILNIAPNPTQDAFVLKTKATGSLKITVTDLTGDIFYEGDVSGAPSELILGAEWPRGLYILKVQSGDDLYLEKLNKQ